MKVDQRNIIDIKPYPKNAKEHPKKQIEKISASISAFGFNQPIVVDKEGVIIVGHGRYYAAIELQMDKVPVLEIDLSEEKAKAYRLADNKLNESDWDMDLAVEELKELSLEMVRLTGFDENLILETTEDYPDLSDLGEPKSKLGDVYELGPHKLVCGDSTDPETYKKLFGEDKARVIFTDPPYSIDYQSGSGISAPSPKFQGEGKIIGDDRTPQEALQFYKDVLTQMKAYSTPDSTLYWWHAMRLVDINMQAMRETGWHFSQIVFWLNNSLIFSQSQLYHRIYEPCIVAWQEDGTPHFQNRAFTKFSELWTLDKKTFAENLDVVYQKRDSFKEYIHPTQKPVQLAERALKRSSEVGDLVLDAFGGSGSTLIACDQLGRKARMIELDPKYVDAAIGRYLQYTETTTVIRNGKEILW